jgi:hypothetical protein
MLPRQNNPAVIAKLEATPHSRNIAFESVRKVSRKNSPLETTRESMTQSAIATLRGTLSC